MSNNTNYSLRPEAGPIEYRKHHKRAKEAIKFIIRVLNAAADRVQESQDAVNDDSVDTNRASRICFVSGEPGSGKSTLYLTLRAMLSSKVENDFNRGFPPDINLSNLQGAVRLLDPLDLEVAAEEGENLLAAVLVRLFDELTRDFSESSPANTNSCEDAVKELEELATDIGIAWEGNLRARAGALDPATYSEEVMHTQRARLGVNRRLKNALDKIARNRCYGCSPKTLFVLPVDDLYLKPDASLQLLRLLRMISVPRLFFLVMGDITTVEALFIEKSLADWTAVAGTRLFADRSDRLDDALSRARELRARYLRKLLPPMQRAKIEPMDWFEALDIEIGRPSASNETLEDLLARVKLDTRRTPDVETANAPDTLLDFLISPPFSQAEKQERKARAEEDVTRRETPKERNRRKDRSAYSALQILDATPREMMDFGSALRELIIKQSKNEKPMPERLEAGEEDTPLLLSLVKDVVDLVREEQNFFTADEQNVLSEILPVRHYFPEDMHFKMDRLCLEPDPWPWKTAGEYRSNGRDSDKLWIRKHRSWNLSVNIVWLESPEKPKPNNGQEDAQPNKPQQSSFNSLPPRPTAWIALLHDLAWTWSHDSITGNLIKRLFEELSSAPAVTTAGPQPNDGGAQNGEARSKSEQDGGAEEEQTLDPLKETYGWAVWRSEQGDKHFPMPKELETFRQLDRFLRVWNSSFEWRDELRKRAFKLRVTAKAKREEAQTIKEQTAKSQREAEADDLTKQADAIDEQADKYLEDENLLYLWGVAGSVVLENQYEGFAEREDNSWFEGQVTEFKKAVVKEGRSGWPKTIYDFLTEDMKLAPGLQGESREG